MTNYSLESLVHDFVFTPYLFESARRALRETGATGVAIAMKEAGAYVCCATAGETVPSLNVQLSSDSGITGACLRSGKTEICHDASADLRVNADACRQLGIASVLVVPIIVRLEIVGIVEALSSKPRAFGHAEQVALKALATEIEVAYEAEYWERPIAPPKPASALTLVPKIETRQVPENQLSLFDDSIWLKDVGKNSKSKTKSARIVYAWTVAVLLVAMAIIFLRSPLMHRNSPSVPAISATGSGDSQLKLATSLAEGLNHELSPQQIAEARIKLAEMFWKGNGVEQNRTSAYFWLLLARAAGSPDALNYERRLSSEMTLAEIVDANVRANQWLADHRLPPLQR